MQKYIFILIAIVCLCLIVQPAIAYNPQELDTVDIYIPYFIQLIDSTASPYDTFWVKAGEIKTAYGIFDDSIQINNAHIIMNPDSDYIYIGENAGSGVGMWNIYIGTDVGTDNTAADYNIGIGGRALKDVTEGGNNIALGYNCGYHITTGVANVLIGSHINEIGDTAPNFNTCIGAYAGYYLAGDYNTFIGANAGEDITGGNNVFIGADAGRLLTAVDSQLLITVDDHDTLIYGEFDNHYVFIKDSLYVPALIFDRVYNDTFDAYWDTLGQIDSCIYADSAVYATFADSATVAVDAYKADSALIAGSAYVADSAVVAADAYTADSALISASTYISDSIFFQQGVTWGSEVWLKDGDTIFVDTTSGAVPSKVDSAGYADTAYNWEGYYEDSLVFQIEFDSNCVYIGENINPSGKGQDNVFIGRDIGKAGNSYGDDNTGIGYGVLYNNTSGYRNVGIGNLALGANTTGYDNFAMGAQALRYNKTGYRNVAIGYNAGFYMGKAGGHSNFALGYRALYSDSAGHHNTAIGFESGIALTSGQGNIFMGYQSGYGAVDDYYNVCIGYQAGYSLADHWNVMIGNKAGYYETGAYRLHIAVSNTDSLIYGEFDNHYVFIKDSAYIPSLVVDDLYGVSPIRIHDAIEITGYLELNGGDQLDKIVRIGSHLAFILNNEADTFYAICDTLLLQQQR